MPTYAGLPLGSSHTVADVRGDVDWAALAAAPGPLILQATAEHLPEAARTLIEYGLADTHAVRGDRERHHVPAAFGRDARSPACSTRPRSARRRARRAADRAAGRDDRQDGGQPREAELVGEPGAVRLDRAGAAHQGPGRRDERDGWSAHGALPIEVPTIAVEPPRSPAQMERAVKGLVDGRYQWVVFTSTNAVRAVWEKFSEFGLDARAFSGVKIACVGQATADRVRAFGIEPELVPAGEQSSLGLLDEFPPYDDIFDPVNRVLLPRADIATETLAEGLRERGWEIEDVTAYRTVRAAPPPAHRPAR